MNYGRLMLDVAGLTLTANEREILARDQVGGLILFARNYQSKQQLLELVADIRQQNYGIVIAVDQEGGRVQRFRDEFVRLPAMHQLYFSFLSDPLLAVQQAREMGWLMASQVRELDVDLSFAPVLDLHWSHSAVIGDRSFGVTHQEVSRLALSFMSGMRDAGMCSTAKHFPGHGWAVADSHLQTAVDNRSFAQIEKDDLQPFVRAIEQGLDGLMPAHVIYSQVDDKPAGFSAYWLQDVLRKQLKFDGVIFSDDLNMNGAAVETAHLGQYAARAQAALTAGCDTVLVCNNAEGAIEVLDFLEKENIEKSHRLANMRGAAFSADQSRLERASVMAEQLMSLTA